VKLLCVLAVFLFLFGQAVSVGAMPAEQQRLFHENINYFDHCGGTDTSATDNQNTPSVDLDALAKKYDLQSAIVKKIGGDVIGSSNADQPPAAPASVLKSLIADVLLHNNPDLSKNVTVQAKELYSSSDGSAGQSMKLADVLKKTLSEESWDTGANSDTIPRI
jgi:hypothetical protein